MSDQAAIDVDWDNWTAEMRSMLVFIRREDEVLLIRKKRGLGEGKINGPGGKVDEGETVEQAAVRETEEEVGLIPKNLERCGELYFQFKDGLSIHCTVFMTEIYEGKLTETDEAKPMWVKVDEIPFDEMWEDDQFWLPQVLAGDTFEGYFTFDDDTMLSKDLRFGSDPEPTEADEPDKDADESPDPVNTPEEEPDSKDEDAPDEEPDSKKDEEDAPDEEPDSEEDDNADDASVEAEASDDGDEEEDIDEEDEEDGHGFDDATFLQLQRIVESLIMASETPMTIASLVGTIHKVVSDQQALAQEAAKEGEAFTGPDVAWAAEVGETAIIAAIGALNASYEREGRAFMLSERASGYRMFTRPGFGLWVRGLFPDQKPQRLRPPALETLAIIAYRQPLTKADIEAVRGVSVDGVLKMLLDRNLVQIAGRSDAPGRPLLYETSDMFLDHFGIRTVDELPNADELRKVELPKAEVEAEPEAESDEASSEEDKDVSEPDESPAEETDDSADEEDDTAEEEDSSTDDDGHVDEDDSSEDDDESSEEDDGHEVKESV